MPGLIGSRAIAILAVSILISVPTVATAQIHFDLRAQPMAAALTVVGNIANMNVLFDSALVDGLRAPPLKGELSAEAALTQLLAGTRLRLIRVNANTVSVVTEAEAKRADGARDPSTGAVYAPEGIHLAYVGTGLETAGGDSEYLRSDESNPKQAGESRERERQSDIVRRQPGDIAEVLVTAQKRTERLQDVPVPVTSITATDLVETNQLRLQDYYTSIPGFNVMPTGLHSTETLSIRGISTGPYNNPSVGVTVDDVPYGASTQVGGGAPVPDIDPSDLARIEVLRGPQGTLYGASSIGGLLKFVTVDPTTDAVNGHLQAGTSSVRNGAELGYSVRGAANLPIGDTLAIRVSGFSREDPGYIDNPVLHIDGINKSDTYGGHLAALWKPSQNLSLKFSALYQHLKADGSSDIDVATNGYVGPALGDLQQNYIAGVGGFDRKVQAYSLTLSAKMGIVDLTAVSGLNINQFSDSFDYSYALEGFFGPGGVPLVESNKTTKFTQEVRLSVPLGQKLEWLFGGFYTHERSPYQETVSTVDLASGNVISQLFFSSNPTTFQEYAAFTDLTYHVTDRFDLQVGGRESQIRQTAEQVETGPIVGGEVVNPEEVSKANAFTYLVTPRFKISRDLMVYARLASGYRAGGVNLGPGLPPQFSPDKTQNYEIGIKGDVLNRALSFDASLYYIDWKDIQIGLVTSDGFGYTSNSSRAKSQGVEISLESRPAEGLTISGWLAFADAKLTADFPADSTANGGAYGVSGDQLPGNSRFSASLSVQQGFPIADQLSGFVGGSVSYVGKRLGDFNPTPVRQEYPAYAKFDLRAGVDYGSWSANLYCTNLTDRRGVLAGGFGDYPPFAFTYIQPRTLGLSLSKSF